MWASGKPPQQSPAQHLYPLRSVLSSPLYPDQENFGWLRKCIPSEASTNTTQERITSIHLPTYLQISAPICRSSLVKGVLRARVLAETTSVRLKKLEITWKFNSCRVWHSHHESPSAFTSTTVSSVCFSWYHSAHLNYHFHYLRWIIFHPSKSLIRREGEMWLHYIMEIRVEITTTVGMEMRRRSTSISFCFSRCFNYTFHGLFPWFCLLVFQLFLRARWWLPSAHSSTRLNGSFFSAFCVHHFWPRSFNC